MAVKPVKFVSDILTRKQILKTDLEGNVLFSVSSSNGSGNGTVSSSLPITASSMFIDGDAYISGTLHAKRMHVTEVTTSVYYEDSISASINALNDVSASDAISGSVLQWNGNAWVGSTSLNIQNLNIVGNLTLTGSALNTLGSPSNNHDVAQVLSSIDGLFAAMIQNYAKLSETQAGYFDIGGTKDIEFVNFIASDIENVYVDAMIKYSGSDQYINDLMSVRLYANMGTNKLHVLVDAPSVTDKDSYRIIATKQTGSLF